jgi:hypothetical protein
MHSLQSISYPLTGFFGERHCISAVAFMLAECGVGQRNFRLRNLTRVSMRVEC